MMTIAHFLQTSKIMTDSNASLIPYLGTTGRDLVQNIMILKYANRTINYDETTSTYLSELQLDVMTAFQMHEYNWKKKYATLSLVYNPLNATDYSESRTDTNSGSDSQIGSETNTGTDKTTDTGTQTGTVKDDHTGTTVLSKTGADTEKNTGTSSVANTGTTSVNDTVTKNDTVANSERTYDDSSITEISAQATTGTDTDNSTTTNNLSTLTTNDLTKTDTHNTTDTTTDNLTDLTTNNLSNSNVSELQHGHVVSRNDTQNFGHVLNSVHSVSGRDNLTAQDLIQQEREVAEYNFYEMIADEVTDFISLLNYNF